MEGNEEKVEVQYIDIDQVFKNKNPKLHRLIPGFIIRYLKRIIHQDEINKFLKKNGHLTGLEFISVALKFLNIRYKIFGFENIPQKGRFIFISNHPLGGLDGLVFMKEVGKIFPNLKFPVNDLLMNLVNLKPLFLPINKHGSQAREAARLIEEAYSSNCQILHFPAGLCSRKIAGSIVDIDWKKHFISKAIEHKRDVIPVHFSGRNSNFFYNLANLRTLLGIKSNIEMIYLPNEMFKQRDKEITVKFGKPISFEEFDPSFTHREWAERVKHLVYALGKGEIFPLKIQ
jgi:putative hemolysin